MNSLCIETLDSAIKAMEPGGTEELLPLEWVQLRALKELRELKKMKKQGLLLKLPCKIGDTVYITDGSSLTVREIHVQDNLVKYFVARFNPNGLDVRFVFDRIGKTVFLTREEAEKKLEEMNGE